MVRGSRLAALSLLAGLLASAEPQLLAERDLPHGMGLARRLHLPVDGGVVAAVAVTLVPQTYRARLLDQSPTFPVGARSVAVSRQVVPEAVVAITGGYFQPDFQPSGLLRIDGRALRPLSDDGVLSGIVAITQEGALRLLARGDGVERLPTAFQAGPYLIDPGGAVGVRPSPASARRTLIAVDDHGRVLLLASAGALPLHRLATLLHDHPVLFGLERVERALNLDGGPSTGLSLAFAEPEWSVVERGPVRNVVVVSPDGGMP
jgi:uncharacterized protein YigE (DUF2233 family)